jgi:hypothetical protein
MNKSTCHIDKEVKRWANEIGRRVAHEMPTGQRPTPHWAAEQMADFLTKKVKTVAKLESDELDENTIKKKNKNFFIETISTKIESWIKACKPHCKDNSVTEEEFNEVIEQNIKIFISSHCNELYDEKCDQKNKRIIERRQLRSYPISIISLVISSVVAVFTFFHK